MYGDTLHLHEIFVFGFSFNQSSLTSSKNLEFEVDFFVLFAQKFAVWMFTVDLANQG
jgi:hypothetical protein